MAANGLSDSYVEEEIGECLSILGRPDEAASHFSEAAALLDAGGPGEDPNHDRLAHLRSLADQRMTTPEPGIG